MTAGRTNCNQKSKSWCTPPKYVEAINIFFNTNLELDPCSNEYSLINAKNKYQLPYKDGIIEDWNYKTIFVNPPYGADRERGTTIKDWIRKCYEANKLYHAEVLALVPVATNTRHWKDYVFGKAIGICFLYDTRLHFYINGHEDEKGAPMSCAMIYWGKDIEKFVLIFSKFGAALDLSSSFNICFGHQNNSILSQGKLI